MNAMNEQTRAAVEEVRRTDCEFLTVPQVAKILKVNKNMVYDLIGVRLLRAVKLGSTKVATIAVEDFIRDMDASLNLEGGIHFVLAWIMLFLLYPFHFALSTLKQKTRVAKPFG